MMSAVNLSKNPHMLRVFSLRFAMLWKVHPDWIAGQMF